MTDHLDTVSRHAASLPPGWIQPDFGADLHGKVAAIMSARAGGVSKPPYDSCNLGDHVEDDAQAVSRNREVFAQCMQAWPVWLKQVHGNHVVRLTRDLHCTPGARQAEADGALTTEPGIACTVMVADCLPILLAAPDGRGVAALHAGWRGLAGAGGMKGRGIVHTGVQALCEATSADPGDLRAWLGPCIGPSAFEVGPEVLMGFGVDPAQSGPHQRFVSVASAAKGGTPKWLANLPALARDILESVDVTRVADQNVSGQTCCTVSEPSRFFSFRRDGVTGRQAAGIWLL